MKDAIARQLAGAILVSALCASAVYPQGFSGCPPCWRNYSVMPGHGAAPGDPRRLINVRIDQTFGSQTAANVWNATCAGSQTAGCSNVSGPSAIQMWNAVPTYYNLRLVQNPTQPDEATDIQITRDPTWNRNACAYTQHIGKMVPDAEAPGRRLFQVTKRVIHLPPGSENWSQGQLACALGHEFGHSLGLDHISQGCPASIMNPNRGGRRGCTAGCPRTQVSDGDVQAVNQQAGNRLGCNKDAQPVSRIVNTGGGMEDPNPYRYYPTCYYFYEAIDLYYCRWISVVDGSCHPETPPEYIGTIYVLTGITCY